jgi:hypothetical protein
MKTRQAKKIIQRQAIRCRRRIDGPEDVTTAGRRTYPEATYRKALRVIHRKMDRELTDRKPGAISRLAALDAERTQARIEVLKARSAPASARGSK